MIVIPMAGAGQRFVDAGFSVPKFKLELGGQPILIHVLKGFEPYFETEEFLFVCRAEQVSAAYIESICLTLGILKFNVIFLNGLTRGQAETVQKGLLQHKENRDSNDRLYIFNIDTIRKPEAILVKDPYVDGFLEVFNGEGEAWSFAELDAQGNVIRTTEKNRISNYCSDGLYFFRSIKLFLDAFSIMEKSPDSWDGGELYIAPLYNILIDQGFRIVISEIDSDKLLFAGTPKEYGLAIEKFARW